MNQKQRKWVSTLATVLVIILSQIAEDAKAATAFLVECNAATSVTGRFVWVGVYDYAGQLFQRTFSSHCPPSVSVY